MNKVRILLQNLLQSLIFLFIAGIFQIPILLPEMAPSFFVTLQQMDGEQWKDRGPWYFVAMGGQRVHTLSPGDTLNAIDLDLRDVVDNMDLIRSSGLYRIHFEIYKDEDLEELIPVTDRVSDLFTVIL